MILLGGGGIGVVVLDVLMRCDIRVDYIVDGKESLRSIRGVPVVRDAALTSPGDTDRSRHELIVCMGDPARKAKLVERYPGRFGKAIDPSAIISTQSTIGEGSVAFQGTIVQTNSRIGRHVIINTAASIDHDCDIDDFVHIAPHSTLCGFVRVQRGAQISAGATIIPGVTVGANAIVGAGAVVIRDVAPNTLVGGVPARHIKTIA